MGMREGKFGWGKQYIQAIICSALGTICSIDPSRLPFPYNPMPLLPHHEDGTFAIVMLTMFPPNAFNKAFLFIELNSYKKARTAAPRPTNAPAGTAVGTIAALLLLPTAAVLALEATDPTPAVALSKTEFPPEVIVEAIPTAPDVIVETIPSPPLVTVENNPPAPDVMVPTTPSAPEVTKVARLVATLSAPLATSVATETAPEVISPNTDVMPSII